MFKLFRIEDKSNQPIKLLPQWPFIKSNAEYNINRVQNYYRTNTTAVPSNHILVTLLQSLAISKELDIDTFFRRVRSIALSHANANRLTSSYGPGSFFNGMFYGKGSKECLLVTDDYFDYNNAHANWQTLSPVKVLMHDKSDLSMLLPSPFQYSTEKTNAVILINLPMLAIQYRAFYHEYMKDGNRNNRQKATTHFVGQFVLPNMLRSHLDMCFLNRVINKFYNKKITYNYTAKHPFTLIDVERHVDGAIIQVLEYIDNSPKRFDLILKTIPSFTNKNMYESLLMPDITPTKQVHWATMVARLKYINALFDMAAPATTVTNGNEVNEVILELNYGDLYNVFKRTLPLDLFFNTQNQLDNIASYLINNSAFKH